MTPDDVREQARSLKEPGGIAGWVGWYRAALETGAQIRTLAQQGASNRPVLAVAEAKGIPRITEEIKQAVPHAAGALIEGCGHLVTEEKPAELAALLRTHFARQPISS